MGIDPGVAKLGIGVIEKKGADLLLIHYGVVLTNPKDQQAKRLQILYQETSRFIRKFKPELAIVEKLFFFKNLKTALPVSEARGVILLALTQNKIKIKEFTPLQIKMGVCGYGRANKQQVQKMIKEILNLDQIPKPDDAADAIAAALCGAYSLKNIG